MADNMNGMTITAANSSMYITVPGLYDAPVKIEGYASDAAIQVAQNNPAVTEMGIDGHLSMGWVPTAKEVTVGLAADSPSLRIFEDWATLQEATREVMVCNAEITIPSINRKIVGIRGCMTTAQTFPSMGQTLQAAQYVFTFESLEVSPL